VKLVVLEGPAARPFFEIFHDRTLIGRAPDCERPGLLTPRSRATMPRF